MKRGTRRIWPFTGEAKVEKNGNPLPQCFVCGEDAKWIDPHFPFHTQHNRCEKHYPDDPAELKIVDLGWNTETAGNGTQLRAYLGQTATPAFDNWPAVLHAVEELAANLGCCPQCGSPSLVGEPKPSK